MGEGAQVCALEAGGTSFVVDIRRVEEVLVAPAVTPVPGGPSFVSGVVSLRGAVVPVVDVRDRLGLTPQGPKSRHRLVVCRLGRRRVGLLVDAVTQVLWVPLESIRPTPIAAGPGVSRFVVGVCGEAPRLRLLLDVRALVGS